MILLFIGSFERYPTEWALSISFFQVFYKSLVMMILKEPSKNKCKKFCDWIFMLIGINFGSNHAIITIIIITISVIIKSHDYQM